LSTAEVTRLSTIKVQLMSRNLHGEGEVGVETIYK